MILDKKTIATFVNIVQEIEVFLLKVWKLAAENKCMCNIIFSIDPYLNREIKPVRPIRRHYTKRGGCYLAFSPIPFVQGQGLNDEFSL